MLMFGLKRGSLPNDILENYKNENLFQAAQSVDDSIAKFEEIYSETYAIQIKKWLKWKNQGQPLKVGSVVYVLDRYDKETLNPTLGVISKEISERSYQVLYVKRKMKIDEKTLKMTKQAKKAYLERPAQALSLICSTNECNDFNLEVFPNNPNYDQLEGEINEINDLFRNNAVDDFEGGDVEYDEGVGGDDIEDVNDDGHDDVQENISGHVDVSESPEMHDDALSNGVDEHLHEVLKSSSVDEQAQESQFLNVPSLVPKHLVNPKMAIMGGKSNIKDVKRVKMKK